jgi:hypothetical protein
LGVLARVEHGSGGMTATAEHPALRLAKVARDWVGRGVSGRLGEQVVAWADEPD